ncbi:BP74-related protein [Actinomadura montaniterrae]|uniref:Calmodulin-binding protein n=1 Tax=Actinomadura montaniterrae TaxID=1803903 RepID=A0A6L3VZJ9_9ACTN|nr:calmodulin-binding protein [Actinomadura montaniterrae]KAB2381621.1 calmodulin-binding protein [Actinomadura montaniterrae]
MRRVFTNTAGLAALGALAFATAQPAQAGTLPAHQPARAAADTPAYFEMTDVTRERFVIKLTKSEDIQHARALVNGETNDRPHVITRITKRQADYNPRWSYHANPDTTQFFDQAFEVCDATIPYVEDNLDEAGGPFLPGLVWCDWTSRLIREIPAP